MPLSQIETASLSTGLVAPTATSLTTALGSAPSYSARAWVNFNGTGTVAIRASGNVSSITDNGAGDYTVNFTTAMPDANCSVAGSAKEADSGTSDALFKIAEVASNPAAGNVRVISGGPSTAFDCIAVLVSVFR